MTGQTPQTVVEVQDILDRYIHDETDLATLCTAICNRYDSTVTAIEQQLLILVAQLPPSNRVSFMISALSSQLSTLPKTAREPVIKTVVQEIQDLTARLGKILG